jgi:hypothetical protein
VSKNLSPIASQARDVLLLLLRSGNSIHLLLISNPPHTDSDSPRGGTFNNWLPAIFKLCSTTTNTFTTLHVGQNSSGMQKLVSPQTTMGLQQALVQFCGQIFMDKNHGSQTSPQTISVDPPHTRLARKPPD